MTAITYYIIYRKRRQSKTEITPRSKLLLIDWLTLGLIGSALIYLYHQQSLESLQSPWSEISWLFLLFYWSLAAVGLSVIKLGKKIAIITIIAWWLLTYSLTSLVYFSSFGFDPFIHQAAEKTIINQGVILPKTPYYIGQYSLVISLNRLTGLSIGLIERWLIPLLSAVFLAWLIIDWFKKNRQPELIGRLIAWTWPIFSWPIFIVTAPQNLAYFFLIVVIISATTINKNRPLLWSAALASLACQPLAGLPAITIAGLTELSRFKKPITKVTSWLIGSLTGLILPLSLWWSSWQQTGQWRLIKPPVRELISWLSNFLSYNQLWPNQENWLLNLIYSWQAWQPLVALILIFSGWRLIKQRPDISSIIKPLNLSLAIGLILSSLVSFNFIIDYERYNYLTRFIWLFLIINLPAGLMAGGWLAKKFLATTKQKISWPIIITLASLSLFGLYLTYPRVDNYSNAKGLSTGQADFLAVRWIEDNASTDYIVLANQQVSAAALAEFGFYPDKHARYLQNNIFYYPIPTSGLLYNYYLKMVNNYPSRQTITDAATLAGVKQAYFVLNNYWYGFEKLAKEAQEEADLMTSLADGQIIIFSYNLSEN